MIGLALRTVAIGDALQFAARELGVHLGDVLGPGDAILNDDVDQAEQSRGGLEIVAEVKLPWMDSLISDNPKAVERLLDHGRQPGLHELANSVVEISAVRLQVFNQLLSRQAEKAARASYGSAHNGARLLVVAPDVLGHVHVRTRSPRGCWQHHDDVASRGRSPKAALLAIQTHGHKYVQSFVPGTWGARRPTKQLIPILSREYAAIGTVVRRLLEFGSYVFSLARGWLALRLRSVFERWRPRHGPSLRVQVLRATQPVRPRTSRARLAKPFGRRLIPLAVRTASDRTSNRTSGL